MQTQPIDKARWLALFSLCLGVVDAFVSPLFLGLMSIFVYNDPCEIFTDYCNWYDSLFLFWIFGLALMIGAASLVTGFVSLRIHHEHYGMPLCGALLGVADILSALLAFYSVTHM